MRQGVMSAGWLRSPDQTAARETVRPAIKTLAPIAGWNPENFAQEQIRALVRQVFFSRAAQPVRQIVFSSAEPDTEVRSICRRVGEALALEIAESIAVVGENWQTLRKADHGEICETSGSVPLRRIATRVRANLWLVPVSAPAESPRTSASLHCYMGEIRREFEYSIVAGPPAGESNEATAMAQFADGIILVLSAHRTRRAAARKIKETIEAAQARLLGTVLSDREFPIPDAIYRRL